eukprot:scaffold827_cov36-Phaeocystis_antarctica.AAC.5
MAMLARVLSVTTRALIVARDRLARGCRTRPAPRMKLAWGAALYWATFNGRDECRVLGRHRRCTIYGVWRVAKACVGAQPESVCEAAAAGGADLMFSTRSSKGENAAKATSTPCTQSPHAIIAREASTARP